MPPPGRPGCAQQRRGAQPHSRCSGPAGPSRERGLPSHVAGPCWGKRPTRTEGRGCRTGSLLTQTLITAFLLLSGYHWSFGPDRPPGPPWLAGAYLGGARVSGRGARLPGLSWESGGMGLRVTGKSWDPLGLGHRPGGPGAPHHGLICSLIHTRVPSSGNKEVGSLGSGFRLGRRRGQPLSPGIVGRVDSPW